MELKRMNAKLQPAKPTWQIFAAILLAIPLLLSGCITGSASMALYTPTQTGVPLLITNDATPAPTASPTPTRPAPLPVSTQPAGLVDPNCTYSSHYWQGHPELWATDNLIIGRFSFTKSDALALFTSGKSDSTTLILKEFISAALNILKGAEPAAVEAEMITAGDWLNAHPPGIVPSSSENQKGLEIAANLQAFNGGTVGPGTCKDEPPTPTPTATMTPTITPTPTRTPILPSETPTPTATERYIPAPISTSKPTEKPAEQPTSPPPTNPPPPTKEPPPTSAPTEAPPPPAPAPNPAGQVVDTPNP